MPIERFVGRVDVSSQLRRILEGQGSDVSKLTIQSIEGPGGIGKTALFEHVFNSAVLNDRRYLRMQIDGNKGDINSLQNAVEQLCLSATAKPILRSPPGYFFPHTTRVIETIKTVKTRAMAEIAKQFPTEANGRTALSAVLDRAFSLGRKVNEMSPWTRRYLNVQKIEPRVVEAIPKLASLQNTVPWFYEKMGIGSTALRNAVKENACRPLAQSLVSDLTAILTKTIGWKEWVSRITHAKIRGSLACF